MAKLPNDRAARMLTELMQEPGNGSCADCKSPNPRWASYNLGIFLCMGCASIHRKLGVHISKVKSINLDEWTKDQIDHIRVTGNLNSNAIFNPNNVDPPVNLHDSERDSELEKYIRNKYQYRKFMNLRSIGSSTSQRSKGQDTGGSEANKKSSLAVAPPARTSSSPQPTQPTRASPALTTKSPPPTKSPAPVPTPSPSIPTTSPQPPLQMLAAPAQPPLQMLSPSPPLQMLSPSSIQTMQTGVPMGTMGMGVTSFQTGMPTMMTGAFQTPMYTATPASTIAMGGMVNPVQGMQGTAAPGTVWSDMAAIQTGPAMPAFQYPINTGVGFSPNVMPNTFTGMSGISNPIGAASMASMAPMQSVTPMGGLMNTTYTGVPSMQMGYMQTTGLPNLQATQYGQQVSPYGAQQTQILSPQPQGFIVRDGTVQPIPQPSPGIPGGNPAAWPPGMGYGMGTQGQWHA